MVTYTKWFKIRRLFYNLGEYQTFYLDLATNQTYMLSEAIEMTDIIYYKDYYIVRG